MLAKECNLDTISKYDEGCFITGYVGLIGNLKILNFGRERNDFYFGIAKFLLAK